MDPANPELHHSECYLKPSFAIWIDVIHTDMDIYGTPPCTETPSPTCMGTAEYFVNNGTRLQPGCPPNTVPLNPESNNRSY